jgi:hypothetical protein
MTTKTVSNDDIRDLRDEAASAGDTKMVALCEQALFGGHPSARQACEDVIAYNRAQCADR